MKTQQLNTDAFAIVAQSKGKVKAQTADQANAPADFAKLLRAYEVAHASGADTTAPLYALATACALSVLKKCIDPQRKTAETREAVSNSGLSSALTAVRRGILADMDMLEKLTTAHNDAYALEYNKNGDMVQVVVDKTAEKAATALQSETMSDGLDLVNSAVVAILEQTAEHAHRANKSELVERVKNLCKAEEERTKREDISNICATVTAGICKGWNIDRANAELEKHGLRCMTEWIEAIYKERRPARKVLIKSEDTAKWEDVETSPIHEVYRAVRREVQNSRAMQTDPRNGYLYIEDTIADPESDKTESIYRRLNKWADLGGYTRTGDYTADMQNYMDYNDVVEHLNLTDRQACIVALRMRGYGYKAIATYMGVNVKGIKIELKRLQTKCSKFGFTPEMWLEMANRNIRIN